jgi:hypothetical protein
MTSISRRLLGDDMAQLLPPHNKQSRHTGDPSPPQGSPPQNPPGEYIYVCMYPQHTRPSTPSPTQFSLSVCRSLSLPRNATTLAPNTNSNSSALRLATKENTRVTPSHTKAHKIQRYTQENALLWPRCQQTTQRPPKERPSSQIVT